MKKAPAKALSSSVEGGVLPTIRAMVVQLRQRCRLFVMGYRVKAWVRGVARMPDPRFPLFSGQPKPDPGSFPKPWTDRCTAASGMKAEGSVFVSQPARLPCPTVRFYPIPRGHGMNSRQRTRPPQVLQIHGLRRAAFFSGSSSTMIS